MGVMGDLKDLLRSSKDTAKSLDRNVDQMNTNFDQVADSLKQTSDKAGIFFDTLNEYKRPAAIGTAALGTGLAGSKIYQNLKRAEKEKTRDNLYRKRLAQLEKSAAPFGLEDETVDKIKNTAKDMAITGGVGMAVKGGMDAISNAAKSLGSKAALKKNWDNFIEKYPEYEGDDQAFEHFQVMQDTNPAMAKHPVMVKSFLGSTFEHDVINPSTVNTLSKIQQGFDRRDQGPDYMEVGQSIRDAMPSEQDALKTEMMRKNLEMTNRNLGKSKMDDPNQRGQNALGAGKSPYADFTDWSTESMANAIIKGDKNVIQNPAFLSLAESKGAIDAAKRGLRAQGADPSAVDELIQQVQAGGP